MSWMRDIKPHPIYIDIYIDIQFTLVEKLVQNTELSSVTQERLL